MRKLRTGEFCLALALLQSAQLLGLASQHPLLRAGGVRRLAINTSMAIIALEFGPVMIVAISVSAKACELCFAGPGNRLVAAEFRAPEYALIVRLSLNDHCIRGHDCGRLDATR